MPLFTPPSGAGLISSGVASAPADHNFVGWTLDPREIQGGLILPTAGLLNLARVKALGSTVTNIHFHITVPGATLTAGQCFAALYSAAGVLVGGANGITPDASGTGAAGFSTGGFKVMPLTAPQAVTTGSFYYVGWYANGTTMPTFSRALNSSSAALNAGLNAPNFAYATADAGLTTAPPGTFGVQTGSATAYWVALS